MKKIKVANLLEESRFGGPQQRVIIIAKEIQKLVDTTIVCPKKNSNFFEKKMLSNNVYYKLIETNTLKKNYKTILNYLWNFYKDLKLTREVIINIDPDVVHISGGAWQFRSLIACIFLKKKILWHLNDSNANFFIRFVFLATNFLADGFIFSSQRTKKYYEPLIFFKKKNIILQAPVNKISKFKKKKRKKIVIGNIGNFNFNKQQDFILKVAKQFKNNENYKFILVGQVFENQKKYFSSLLNFKKKNKLDNIKIIKNPKSTFKYYKYFDAYFCSSKFESSPTSVWNAMANGCSIISFDIGDVKEINKKNPFFYLLTSDDINIVKKKILNIKFVKNIQQHRQIMTLVNKNFDKTSIAKKYYNFIEKFK